MADVDDLEKLRTHLGEVQEFNVEDISDLRKFATGDELAALKTRFREAIEIIRLVPAAALDRLPESLRRSLHRVVGAVRNSRAAVEAVPQRDVEAVKRLVTQMPDKLLPDLIPVLAVCSSLGQVAASTASFFGESGNWQLVGKIGTGGQGAVHRAWNHELRQAGALKTVNPDSLWRGQEKLEGRLRRERDALLKLKHFCVLPLLDFGEEPEPFIVTKIASLGTISDWLGALSGFFQQSIELLLCAAHGLEFVHGRNIVHRDIKPTNVFVLSPRAAALGDFGITRSGPAGSERLTSDMEIVGDRLFAPPEAHEKGIEATPAFDIFSLGATIHSVLVGKLPLAPYWRLSGARYQSLTETLGDDRFQSLDALLRRALDDEPNARPPASALREELSRCAHRFRFSRELDLCPSCGGPTKQARVSDGLHFQRLDLDYTVRPNAQQCLSCDLISLYPASTGRSPKTG